MVKKKHVVKIVVLIAVVVFLISLGKMYDLKSLLSEEVVKMHVMRLGPFAALAFTVLYIAATLLFLPGTPLSIAGGFIFGSWMGTLYVVVGAVLGASLAFFLARFFGQGFFHTLLKEKFKKLDEYDSKLCENGFVTMLFLRLVPLFPFNGLNFALGLTRVKFKDFFLGTLLGIIPGSFVFVSIGANTGDVRSPRFYLAIGAFLLLVLVPTVYKKYKQKHEK
ncbi:MAG: TVP38/TMEM64 family protein [Nanoarchaeota archaeon]|nr:TVP38/TMEM64 family protein [Nanoarchaeota archaeon]